MSVIMMLFHKLRRSCFTADANEVVEIQGVGPRLDVFAVLAVSPTYSAKPDRVSASLSGPRFSI